MPKIMMKMAQPKATKRMGKSEDLGVIALVESEESFGVLSWG